MLNYKKLKRLLNNGVFSRKFFSNFLLAVFFWGLNQNSHSKEIFELQAIKKAEEQILQLMAQRTGQSKDSFEIVIDYSQRPVCIACIETSQIQGLLDPRKKRYKGQSDYLIFLIRKYQERLDISFYFNA